MTEENKQPEGQEPDSARMAAELDALAAQADGDATEGEWIPGGEEEQPRRRAAGSVGAEEFGALYQLLFALGATRLGAHWKLTDEEAEALGEATDRVAEKYGAGVQIGPELGLAVAVLGVTVPRVMVQKEIAEAQRKAEQEKQQGEGGHAWPDGQQPTE